MDFPPAAIDFESIPSISLGTAALLIFGAIASLAVLRGLLRILWGSVVVCLAGLAAFHAWKFAPALGRDWLGTEAGWVSVAVPATTFVLALVILRALSRAIVHPLGTPNEETAGKNRRSPLRWAATLLLSLIPTALILFGGATLLRHVGSVAEIRDFAQTETDRGASEPRSFLARLKTDLEEAVPAHWFESVDPISERARVTLAKLISASDSPPPKAIPVLEEDVVREVVLADPELRRLAREGRYAELLRDPRLDLLLENEKLRAVLADLDL
jgi:hypothetical protein